MKLKFEESSLAWRVKSHPSDMRFSALTTALHKISRAKKKLHFFTDITEDQFTLEADTYYTTFIRGETEDGNHQTTTWYTPIRLAADGLGRF